MFAVCGMGVGVVRCGGLRFGWGGGELDSGGVGWVGHWLATDTIGLEGGPSEN